MITFWEIFGIFVSGILSHKFYLWNKNKEKREKLNKENLYNSLKLNDKQKLTYKKLHPDT